MLESILDRRDFLKLAGAAGLGLAAGASGLGLRSAAATPLTTSTPIAEQPTVEEGYPFTQPPLSSDVVPQKAVTSQSQEELERFLASEEPYFTEFAKTLLLDTKTPYFAAGQKGSQPIPILNRFEEGLDQIAKDPFPVYLEPSATTRQKIAQSYSATVDEIAISRNTTDAISMILQGIDWQPGDELLASTMEYPNCVATMLRVAGRFGVKIRQFGVSIAHSTTADEIVASIQRQIRPGRTKVLFFSCPIQPAGIMVPAPRIARLAQQYGIITLVDGAHYRGQFVPKLDEMGIDFWGISGHKWQCGPGGTGILYVRNQLHAARSINM